MVTWYHWHTEPLLLSGLLTAAWLYTILITDKGYYLQKGRMFYSSCFSFSLLSFYIAVGSPLDALAEAFLFSAHMLQHNLLMYISAPLFILAFPCTILDAFFHARNPLTPVARFLASPVIAGLCFTLVFALWHLPSLYDLALREKWVHAIEHLSMFAVSLQFWWPFLADSKNVPPLSRGGRLLYLFAVMVAQLPLFAVLTFRSDVLYPTYEWAPRISFLSAIEDQILGGLLMKTTNLTVALSLMAWLFLTWEKPAASR